MDADEPTLLTLDGLPIFFDPPPPEDRVFVLDFPTEASISHWGVFPIQSNGLENYNGRQDPKG